MDQWIEESRPANARESESRPFDQAQGGPEQLSKGRRLGLEEAGLDSAARVRSGEWVVEAAIPLPKVACPLKEGLTCAGNICRVRPGGAVKEMVWNPVRGNFRRSAGFGLFKLCGPAPKARTDREWRRRLPAQRRPDQRQSPEPRRRRDSVLFPDLGEAVSFSAAEVQRLDLAWTETDAAPSRFYLNNGDEISGRIASITAKTVGIESPSLGRISVPRALVSSISSSGFWLDSRFESGLLSPWKAVAGSCTFSKGVLRLSGATPAGLHQAVLSLPLHQDKTVTLIADYDPTPPFTPVRIQLFADRAHPQMQIQNGIMLEIVPAVRFVVYNDGQPMSAPRLRQRIAAAPAAERVRDQSDVRPGGRRRQGVVQRQAGRRNHRARGAERRENTSSSARRGRWESTAWPCTADCPRRIAPWPARSPASCSAISRTATRFARPRSSSRTATSSSPRNSAR